MEDNSSAFVVESEVEPLIRRVLETHLKDQQYDEKKVATLVHYICEDVMQGLAELDKPFKYVVNCAIMQNTGAGMHTMISEFCDGVNDGMCTVKYPDEKVKDASNINAIVTVFGLAIFNS